MMRVDEYLETKGRYFVKRPIPIKAVQMPNDFIIKTLHGKAHGKKGDYVARTPRGDIYPIAQDIFKESYQPIKKEDIESYEKKCNTYEDNG